MKTEKITKLNTGLTTIIGKDGKIEVFTEREMEKTEESWSGTIKFLIKLFALGGAALVWTYITNA